MSLLTGKRILTIAILTLFSQHLPCLSGVHYHTEVSVPICLQTVYRFSHIPQATLPVPVICLQSSLLIHFGHYFLHISVSSAIFLIAVLLSSLQTISEISYDTLQDLGSIWGSLLFRLHLNSEFFLICCFLRLGESCCHDQFSFISWLLKEI